jgi:hypothetical protein
MTPIFILIWLMKTTQVMDLLIQCLFAGVGLRHKKAVHIDTQSPGVTHVEGVLGIDKGHHPALGLRLGGDVKRKGGLPRRLGTIDLHHPAPRNAADPEGRIQRQGTRGNGRDIQNPIFPHLHDRTPAELTFYLGDGLLHGPCFVCLIRHA